MHDRREYACSMDWDTGLNLQSYGYINFVAFLLFYHIYLKVVKYTFTYNKYPFQNPILKQTCILLRSSHRRLLYDSKTVCQLIYITLA